MEKKSMATHCHVQRQVSSEYQILVVKRGELLPLCLACICVFIYFYPAFLLEEHLLAYPSPLKGIQQVTTGKKNFEFVES